MHFSGLLLHPPSKVQMISSAMVSPQPVSSDMFRPRHLAIFMELESLSTYAAYVPTNVPVVLHTSVQIFKIIINIKILKVLKLSLWLNTI
jgi:hypothetical protein